MAERRTCPICLDPSSAQIFISREIYMENGNTDGRMRVSASLCAFRCERFGHVFFLLADDIARHEANPLHQTEMRTTAPEARTFYCAELRYRP